MRPQINLFDPTFFRSKCSTGWREPTDFEWIRNQQKWDGITVFVDGDMALAREFIAHNLENGIYPLCYGWLHEPPCLWKQPYDDAPGWLKDFTGTNGKILTYHPELLKLEGYAAAPYAGVWIDEHDWGLWPKTRDVSMLVGEKVTAAGHIVRQDVRDILMRKQWPDEENGRAGYGVDLYGTKGIPTNYSMATKRLITRDYRFSIVVETCNLPNLFTEITLDCIAMGTIPVLRGCPNLGEFLDPNGIIHWETPEELLALLPTLTPALYESKLPAARANLERLPRYANCDDWLYHWYWSSLLENKWIDYKAWHAKWEAWPGLPGGGVT
jgi:hypothetical protein